MSLRRKRLAREAAETAPYYMCAEVGMKDVPGYAKLFSAVEHLGHADGVVDTKRMDDGSITAALSLLEKKFRGRGVSCAACYADYLVRDAVNVGVYFNSPDEEASFARAFQGNCMYSLRRSTSRIGGSTGKHTRPPPSSENNTTPDTTRKRRTTQYEIVAHTLGWVSVAGMWSRLLLLLLSSSLSHRRRLLLSRLCS